MIRLALLLLVFFISTSACSQVALKGANADTPVVQQAAITRTSPPKSTPTASPTSHATSTPTIITPSGTPPPSPTAVFTETPTAIPTLAPINLARLPYITLSNVARLTRLGQISAGPQGALSAGFAFSPDGRLLGLDDGLSVQIWDLSSGQPVTRLSPPDATYAPAGSLVFSPDGTRLARIYRQSRIILWDIKTGEILNELQAGPNTQALFHLAYPTANRLVASAGTVTGTGLSAWDVCSGDLISEATSGSYQADGFAISPNGGLVIQAGKDGTLRFWEPNTGKLAGQQIMYACQDTLSGAAFSPDGYLIVLQCETSGAKLYLYAPNYYRIGDLTLLGVQESDWRGTGQMSFNRDGALLAAAVGSPPRQILFWDMASQAQLLMIDALPGDLRQLEFSRDGRLLAFRMSNGVIEIWGVP